MTKRLLTNLRSELELLKRRVLDDMDTTQQAARRGTFGEIEERAHVRTPPHSRAENSLTERDQFLDALEVSRDLSAFDQNRGSSIERRGTFKGIEEKDGPMERRGTFKAIEEKGGPMERRGTFKGIEEKEGSMERRGTFKGIEEKEGPMERRGTFKGIEEKEGGKRSFESRGTEPARKEEQERQGFTAIEKRQGEAQDVQRREGTITKREWQDIQKGRNVRFCM